MTISYVFMVILCIVLLVKRKNYYLRKNKKGKYTLLIPKKERIAENVIKAEREISIINHKKKKGSVVQYQSLNKEQLLKLENLRKEIKNI